MSRTPKDSKNTGTGQDSPAERQNDDAQAADTGQEQNNIGQEQDETGQVRGDTRQEQNYTGQEQGDIHNEPDQENNNTGYQSQTVPPDKENQDDGNTDRPRPSGSRTEEDARSRTDRSRTAEAAEEDRQSRTTTTAAGPDTPGGAAIRDVGAGPDLPRGSDWETDLDTASPHPPLITLTRNDSIGSIGSLMTHVTSQPPPTARSYGDQGMYHFEDFQLARSGSYRVYKTKYGYGLDFLEHGADFEAAISATGFGRFHFCLLAITGLIYANTAIGITIVSFVLPTATCDFKMTSADKGWLTAAPMLGMVLGSYFWGCLADTKGRKTVLVSTLLLDGFVGILSSFVQILPIFMACRFVNGFSVAGAMGICFPYLGEFQQTKYREKILCWMEMFWTLGVILLPLIAWGIIPITGIRIETKGFSYDSWNWFVAACGVPSLCLGFWLLAFPESPKFMMECGDYDDALECLKAIYKANTGDDPNNYPIKSLKEKIRSVSVASQSSQKSVRSLSMRKPKDLKRLFSEIWVQTKALCRPPYLKYTILTCLIQFGLTTSYYTLMIWFPELFNRYEEYEHRFPNLSASVCDVSSVVTMSEATADPFDCAKTIDGSVYMHTLIVGLACIPTSLWLPLCVHKLGAKFFLIFSLSVAGVVTMGLYFVQNSTQNLVLSCIFEALTSLAISLVFCVLVDLFPTNLRVMAAALSLTAGRGGGLIGNLSFGYLIDINCVVPIVVFSAFLIIAAILCFFLPKTGQEALD